METDCYPKFLRSSEYSTIMQKRNHQLFPPTSSQSSKNVSDASSPQMPKSSSRSLQSTLSPPISKQKKVKEGLRIKLDKKRQCHRLYLLSNQPDSKLHMELPSDLRLVTIIWWYLLIATPKCCPQHPIHRPIKGCVRQFQMVEI